MKLTITLSNGMTVSAFVDKEKKKLLVEQIMEENCYEDKSEIEDWDYINTALIEHDYLRIFDKPYNKDGIESYDVNHKARETKAQKQKRILSYLTIYNDALKYAEEFFHYEMIRAFVIQKDGRDIQLKSSPRNFRMVVGLKRYISSSPS